MFGISCRDWYRDDLESSFPVTIVIGFFILFPLIMLVVFGLGSGTDSDGITQGPYKECLYIGLPILFGIWLPILSNLFFKTKIGVFNKSGFVWERLPYIVWIIKGCVSAVCSGYIVLVACPIFILMVITKILVAIISILGVICTTPDGKAEAKIKQIWD